MANATVYGIGKGDDMSYSALKQYQQNSVFTATPEELVLMLYDGGIKFMNIAKYNIANNQTERAHSALVRAQDIVLELSSSLNMEYQISDGFKALYEFILDSLISANVNKDPKPIEDALGIMTEMRDAWKTVIRDVKKAVYQNRRV